MARLKAVAQKVPQTLAEAEHLAAELGENLRVLDRHNSRVASDVAAVQVKGKEISGPMGKEIDAQFKALTAFAQAHRADILPADRKSLQIAAGTIGWRLGNKALVVEAGMEDAVIDYLDTAAPHMLREVVSLDKEALLADPEFVEGLEHVSISQTETFFFKPLAVDLEKTKTTGKVPAEKDAA